MMIAHVSIPADDPKHVARVLAEIMGGEAMFFPPGGADTWMAWSGDSAVELEIVPRGGVMARGADGGHWLERASAAPRATESHVAIGVDRQPEEIMAIAEREGWPTGRYNRGGFFNLVEVWLEGAYLVEFLGPQDVADYKASMTPANWKQVFGVEAV